MSPARRAFITGIGGQDGSYLAERLVADGVEVHALAHVDEGPPAHCPDEVVQHRGDLVDTAATRELLLEVAPTEVYNLAAVSSVARSWDEPLLVARVNALGAIGLMESARLLQATSGRPVRFVQASSAEMFGDADLGPQDESTPVRPTNPYGAAKAHAHFVVGALRAHGLHASSLVLYNHESPRHGPEFVTSKIVRAAVEIAEGRATTLTLGNLESRRDWGWAPDYVDAMVRAARADVPDDYVIATGVAHSVRDLVSSAFTAVGITDWEDLVRVDAALLRPTDSAALVGDASRARDRLGWAPSIGFDELVRRLVDAQRRAVHGR